jgi:nucleoside phosphorylase
MIAVTFALPSESRDFVSLLDRKHSTQGKHVVAGELHGRQIVVLHTGVGEATARARVADFLHAQVPELLISSGFAGALHDQLRVGDLFVAENYSSPHVVSVVQSLPGFPHFQKGVLATTTAILDSAAQRQALANTHGGDAVDMETEFIADACSAFRIPMLSLRAISDTPASPFPAPPDVLFDVARQRIPTAKLVAHLFSHPSSIGKLMRFAQQIATTRKSLTHALDLLVGSENLSVQTR